MTFRSYASNSAFLARAALLAVGSMSLQCGGANSTAKVPDGRGPESTHAPTHSRATGEELKSDIESFRKRGTLTLTEARTFMVLLINRDRASKGLTPVEFDPGPPTVAGNEHARDMATLGFLGHWGSDGSVPEERHTHAGGSAMVMENASCFTDEKRRTIDDHPDISARIVEDTESMFFNEVPPHDGHRKNILNPIHLRVGIGVAQPVATPTEIPVPCFSQEFTDPYVEEFSPPATVAHGSTLSVRVKGKPPAEVKGIGIGPLGPKVSLSVADANSRRGYTYPSPSEIFFIPGYKTRIPLRVNNGVLELSLPLDGSFPPGRYELSVWGSFNQSKELQMVGVRTMEIR